MIEWGKWNKERNRQPKKKGMGMKDGVGGGNHFFHLWVFHSNPLCLKNKKTNITFTFHSHSLPQM